MANTLEGKRIAFVATDGVEQVELTEPWAAVQAAGGRPVLVSPAIEPIQAMNHGEKADTFSVDVGIDLADPDAYDALVLPGGVANPDRLRTDARVVDFVRAFFESGKPVAVICHGPWTLIEAGVLRGRTLTSWPSLRTDIGNAGGTWVDEEVHTDRGLVSSRKPEDLPAFCAKMLEEFAEGAHERHGSEGTDRRAS
jgi:protease I